MARIYGRKGVPARGWQVYFLDGESGFPFRRRAGMTRAVKPSSCQPRTQKLKGARIESGRPLMSSNYERGYLAAAAASTSSQGPGKFPNGLSSFKNMFSCRNHWLRGAS